VRQRKASKVMTNILKVILFILRVLEYIIAAKIIKYVESCK